MQSNSVVSSKLLQINVNKWTENANCQWYWVGQVQLIENPISPLPGPGPGMARIRSRLWAVIKKRQQGGSPPHTHTPLKGIYMQISVEWWKIRRGTSIRETCPTQCHSLFTYTTHHCVVKGVLVKRDTVGQASLEKSFLDYTAMTAYLFCHPCCLIDIVKAIFNWVCS